MTKGIMTSVVTILVTYRQTQILSYKNDNIKHTRARAYTNQPYDNPCC